MLSQALFRIVEVVYNFDTLAMVIVQLSYVAVVAHGSSSSHSSEFYTIETSTKLE